MKRTFFSIVLIGAVFVGSPADADWRDYYDWEAFLVISDGVDKTKLRIGASDKATNGYDKGYDEFAYFGGYIRAYFMHSEWGQRTQKGSDYYVADIRSNTFPQTWDFTLLASRTGRDANISWDLRHVEAEGCNTIELALTDLATGTTTVMTDTVTDESGRTSLVNKDYSYYNASRSNHAFRVTATEIPAATGDAPSGLRSNAGSGAVVLHWDAPTDPLVAGYKLYRSDNGGGLVLISGDALLTDEDGDALIAYNDKTAHKSRGKKGASNSFVYAVTSVNAEGCESADSSITVTR